jgi:hypothetical protein
MRQAAACCAQAGLREKRDAFLRNGLLEKLRNFKSFLGILPDRGGVAALAFTLASSGRE